MPRKLTIFLFFIFALPFAISAQTATVEGNIMDENNKPIDLANIAILNEKGGTTTDKNGFFSLEIPSGKEVTIAVSYIGFSNHETRLKLKEGETKRIEIKLASISTTLPGFEVKDEKLRTESMVRLDPQNVNIAPSMAGGISSILKTLPGVSSNNELSSQYSVRGGNYDENLVVVNDIEIYRPFLVSNSQQEGLNFVNPMLVSSIQFSSGGFGAEYGDKMSSVLDVRYKKPTELEGSLSLSFLGADFSLGGTAAKNKFTYLIGGRYKTTAYILNSVEVKGEYKPNFYDVQSVFTYEFNKKWDLSFLGYYSLNKYQVIPTDRETDFGTFQEVIRFKVYFEGGEEDKYELFQGGLTLGFHPKPEIDLKLIASAFTTDESATYDVEGQYWIGQVENNPGSNEYGEAIATQGVGTFLQHARNYFHANVATLEHKGSYVTDKRYLKWGLRYQYQMMDDVLNEWEMVDSAGYSIPYPVNIPGNPNPYNPNLEMFYSANAKNQVNSSQYSAYFSNRWNFTAKNEDAYTLQAGIRATFWDFNNQFLFSPRLSASYKPYKKQNLVFRFATGIYNQLPFYREMRNMDGTLNYDIKAQQSIQFILGSDFRFQSWNRPFIFTTEVYYKYLDNVIPYAVDNVQIRYYADQVAKGYAAGIDFKLYGEFVKGIDSWFSLSLLSVKEDIYNDYYYNYYDENGVKIGSGETENPDAASNVKVEPGYIPRPTDQRVNFSIFFQDYIPGAPYLKMQLRLLLGTGLPFGPPASERYTQTERMPPYRRVDIGFSYQIVSESSTFNPKNPLKHLNAMWLSLEVFNLLQVYNTVSYTWVTDIYGEQYAVPNYLTPRLLNLKLTIEF
ncbi:MAG TPA: TonB-dependent receptor [Bacteroidales bacterium]